MQTETRQRLSILITLTLLFITNCVLAYYHVGALVHNIVVILFVTVVSWVLGNAADSKWFRAAISAIFLFPGVLMIMAGDMVDVSYRGVGLALVASALIMILKWLVLDPPIFVEKNDSTT